MRAGIVASAYHPPPPPSGDMVAAHLGGYVAGKNASAYSFTVNLGTPAADRLILVTFVGDATGSRAVTSLTIAGQPANRLEVERTGTNLCLAYAQVPSGTSGTVAVGLSDTVSRALMDVFSVIGATNVERHFMTTDGTEISIPISVPSVSIGSVAYPDSATATWGTGWSQLPALVIESTTLRSAMHTDSGTVTPSASKASTAEDRVMGVAVFT